MALFSRSPKHTDPRGGVPDSAGDAAAAQDAAASPADAPASADDAPIAPADTEATVDTAVPRGAGPDAETASAPHVGISMSAFGGFGAGAPAEPAPLASGQLTGEAPPQVESLPGVPDNVILRAALAALGAEPQPHEILNVARQLLQGTVYLRVKGDAQALVAAGKELPLAIATRDDGQFVLAYSSGDALAAAVTADGDSETSAMGQAAPLVLQYTLQNGFDGIIIDQASAPASVVLPRALLERMFTDIDPALTLKRLISQPRTPQTPTEVGRALASAPLWIAVNRASEDDDWGVAESRMGDGTRILPVFSHPLEVVAIGHGDQPMPFTPAQLGSTLRQDTGIDGVVVDAAGPWIRLGRDELAAVLALPEPEQQSDETSAAGAADTDDSGRDDAGRDDAERDDAADEDDED